MSSTHSSKPKSMLFRQPIITTWLNSTIRVDFSNSLLQKTPLCWRKNKCLRNNWLLWWSKKASSNLVSRLRKNWWKLETNVFSLLNLRPRSTKTLWKACSLTCNKHLRSGRSTMPQELTCNYKISTRVCNPKTQT